jgi:hypothetical protein
MVMQIEGGDAAWGVDDRCVMGRASLLSLRMSLGPFVPLMNVMSSGVELGIMSILCKRVH